jgi:hypothetical protein
VIGAITAGLYAGGVPPVPPTSYESIQTITVGGAGASSATFTSIPSTFKHLQIRAFIKLTAGAGGQEIYSQFNADTGANYSWHQLYGNGSGTVASGNANTSLINNSYMDSSGVGAIVIDILDYADTNKYKTSRALGGHDLNGSGYILYRSGNWRNTNAISEIKLYPAGNTFGQYSSFALYGIKG